MKTKLERPDIFQHGWLPVLSKRIGKAYEKIGSEITDDYQPNIAVLVRTRNDRIGLKRIISNIKNVRPHYKGRIDLIVADTESNDGTVELAKKAGATIVPIQQENFSYPASLNKALASVSKDVVATFITVGHAQPVLNNMLISIGDTFKDKEVDGVFAHVVPHDNASIWDQLISFVMPGKEHFVKRTAMGVLGFTNAAIRMSAWKKVPLDEKFAGGGEDTQWAQQILNKGHKILYKPSLAVHHSHGLGFINSAKQIAHWANGTKPRLFNQDKYYKRRPDSQQKAAKQAIK